MIGDFILALVASRARLVDVVHALPLLVLLIEVDEDGVVRLRDTDAPLALVDDRGERLERGSLVVDDGHLAIEELGAPQLVCSAAGEQIWVFSREFLDAFGKSQSVPPAH